MGSLQPWDHDADVGIEIIGDPGSPCDVRTSGNRCFDVFKAMHARFEKMYVGKDNSYYLAQVGDSRGHYVVYNPNSNEKFQKASSWYGTCKKDESGVLSESWTSCFAKLKKAGTYSSGSTQFDLSFSIVRRFRKKEKMLINGHVFRGG